MKRSQQPCDGASEEVVQCFSSAVRQCSHNPLQPEEVHVGDGASKGEPDRNAPAIQDPGATRKKHRQHNHGIRNPGERAGVESFAVCVWVHDPKIRTPKDRDRENKSYLESEDTARRISSTNPAILPRINPAR